jgi:GNAT superfamily N-acetyltransferase
LANPVWTSLTTFHADLALRRGRALSYPLDVARFLGFPDAPSDEDWQDAAGLPGDGSAVFYVSDKLMTSFPPGWDVLARREALQMVAPDHFGHFDNDVELLDMGDIANMKALAAEAGPAISFQPRALELGDFYGVREGDSLVAMGGSRFRGPGWVELSGGCVRTDQRGHGLGRRLLSQRAAMANARDELATLLVFTDNPARHLFTRLGWRTHRTMYGTLLSPTQPADATTGRAHLSGA